MGLKTFDRGIHPSYYKELTSGKSVQSAALPKTVVIPLLQHLGAPCEPLVKKGEVVTEGQKIGEVKAFVTAPVHSSINGKVKDIDFANHPSGNRVLSITIEGDGTVKDWGQQSARDPFSLSVEEMKDAIKEAGIVGMGGAAFPTSVKVSPPKGKSIDTVVLNGCECEPFLTADHRIMLEEPARVIAGLKVLMKLTGAPNGLIGIEENKPDAIAALKGAIGNETGIKIVILETKYPQGAEKMLIQAALGRKVPVGKLPMDVGVLVNNVGTAVAVYEAISTGKPLIERIVTISGNGIKDPKNLKVRVGTLFQDVIDQCGGLDNIEGKEYEVLNGGPMMGIAQSTLQVPVVKGTSGITVLSADKMKPTGYSACIKCTSCVTYCPMGLMPYRLGDFGRVARTDDFTAWGGGACIECGCCSYVCPAKRPLLQWIRVGKLQVRKAAIAAAKNK